MLRPSKRPMTNAASARMAATRPSSRTRVGATLTATTHRGVKRRLMLRRQRSTMSQPSPMSMTCRACQWLTTTTSFRRQRAKKPWPISMPSTGPRQLMMPKGQPCRHCHQCQISLACHHCHQVCHRCLGPMPITPWPSLTPRSNLRPRPRKTKPTHRNSTYRRSRVITLAI